MSDLIILSNEDVRSLLSVSECIDIIEDLFADLSDTQMPPKVYLNIPNGDFRAMPAIVKNTAGIKWCGLHLDKTGKKRKLNIFAKVLINDIDSGNLLSIMDAEAITSIRTAAVTGVATKYLSPIDARIAAFVGCGTQTPHQIEAVRRVRDIEHIKLFDLDRATAEALADTLEGNVQVCGSLEECVRSSDIITTLTPSRKGFIRYPWLKKRCHINAVGADAQGKRELCLPVLRNVDVIVFDEWEQCSHSGEVQYLKDVETHSPLLSLEHIVSGPLHRYWNQSVFDATGLAIEDVATGRYIYEKCKKMSNSVPI